MFRYWCSVFVTPCNLRPSHRKIQISIINLDFAETRHVPYWATEIEVMSWCCKSSFRIWISHFCGTLIQIPNGEKIPSESSQHQSDRFTTLFQGWKSDKTFTTLFNVASILLTQTGKTWLFGNQKNISIQCKCALLVHGFLKHRTLLRRHDHWPQFLVSGLDVVVAVLAEQHVAKLFVSLPKWQESMPFHKFRIQCSNA